MSARPNPIIEYYQLIESGEEVVSEKVRRTYKHLVYRIEHPTEYFFSEARAWHTIDFIERYCKHSKGKLGGKPVRLELWEKAFVAAAFGFIDIEGHRQYREVILIVAKKNGKSLLASAIGLYLQICDNEPGAEVYAVATKKDQAKIIWGEAKRMVRKSPALRKRIKTLVAEMVSDYNESVFKPLASDSDTLDGLNVSGALMDEIHQWKNGRALFDIIADGMLAREQPMILITSTAGKIREDLYDQKYEEAERVIAGFEDPDGYHDEHLLPLVYELDRRAEWTDEKCWKKANPGLGTIKSLEQLRAKVEKAKANPALVKNLLCKEFNIRETTDQAWLTWEQINNEEKFDVKALKPMYGIAGVDLSATTDLTAAKVLFMVPNDDRIYALSMYWIPEDLVEKRVREDKIRYDLWIEQGFCRTCAGAKILPSDVTAWLLEVQRDTGMIIEWVGYDSWGTTYWVDEMKREFGESTMIEVRQGKKTLSAPMKALGADLTAKRIVYNNNPIDKWCLYNTAVDEDINGNIQPKKTNKQTRRIDGTAALLDAYVVFCDKQNDYMGLIAM